MSMGQEIIYPKPGSGMGGFGNSRAYSPEMELKYYRKFVKLSKIETKDAKIMGRNSLCFCGSGKKHKNCHGDISENSMLANLHMKYAGLDADIERMRNSSDVTFVCKKGCCACCSNYFYISQMEYFYIKRYLLETDATAFSAAKQRAFEQAELLKSIAPNEYEKVFSKKDYGISCFDASEYTKGFSNCIFLQNGSCSVYPARPRVCRIYGNTMNTAPCELVQKAIDEDGEQRHLILLDTNDFDEGVNRFWISGRRMILRVRPLFYWLLKDDLFTQNYFDAISMSAAQYEDIHFNSK